MKRRYWISNHKYRELFAAVQARDGMFCHWCGGAVHRAPRPAGERVPDDQATLDHLIERRRGGDNSLENLVMACTRCNTGRDLQSASPPITEEELVQLMGRL